ncbi:methyl-accepting chemotaxis protein [Niveibacterium microcysteis]|uniref:Cache domain-containing protein n=1 Tax=Niveibacterium microcysteis TaxID=2811415 RepID=A0ABX7M505_9RHOO|nr:methyl-accepting chemotaxis protein [Niveibacterium microcysteis]QSI76850.1 cache domain-containing protein [Niveibacterium microcysteis]
MLSSAKLKTKMIAIGVASLVGMLAVGVWGAYAQRTAGIEHRKELISAAVETAHGQLGYYVKLEKDGKLDREAAQAQAKEALRGVRFRGKEYYFVYAFDGKCVLLPPRTEWEGTPRIDEVDKKGNRFIEQITRQGQGQGGFLDYYFPRAGGTEPLRKISYVMGVPEWGWVVGTGLYVDDIDAAFFADLGTNLGVVLLLSAAVFALITVIGRSVLRQIGGEPVDAVAAMHRVASGDLRVQLAGSAPGSLLSELGGLITRLRTTIAELTADAERLGAASQQISATSQAVAGAAHEQSESTQSMAAAMEELTVSISHISDNAQETEHHARDAAEKALKGQGDVESATQEMRALSETVAEAVQRIGSLSARANEVGTVAASINDIASQTNLLALNAAIEAARAGEQGRGFAVVADEVRKLAERTAHATVEIERMVAAIQSETQGAVDVMTTASQQATQGVDAAERSATMLGEIVSDAEQASGRVAEVAVATREQGNVSTLLAGQVEQVARMVESTSVGMTETAQATQELERIASRLNVVVSRFET